MPGETGVLSFLDLKVSCTCVYERAYACCADLITPYTQIIHTKLVAKSLKRLLQRRELRLEEQVSELQEQKATQNARVYVFLYCSCTYIFPTTAEFS